MKYLLPYSAAWLLVLCLMAVNAAPLVFPAENEGYVCAQVDAHNDSCPTDGKEEKSETLKFARHIAVAPPFKLETLMLSFWEQPRQTVCDIYLPIILPPPKAIRLS